MVFMPVCKSMTFRLQYAIYNYMNTLQLRLFYIYHIYYNVIFIVFNTFSSKIKRCLTGLPAPALLTRKNVFYIIFLKIGGKQRHRII